MDKSEWQGAQGQTWAAEWRRTDRSFGILTEHLLASLRGKAFTRLLDIGCGAGELSLAIARGHPEAEIVGVDISPQLVSAARERGANLHNARFECADAAEWQPGAGFVPTQLISRHGVMFFPDPVAAFANLARISGPDAELVFSCFRAPAENPFLTEVTRLLPEPQAPADPHAPGPFAFADQARVAAILQAAGWRDITCEKIDFPMVTGAGEDPVEDAVGYFSAIGPAARVIAAMSVAEREQVKQALHHLAEANCAGGIVSLPAAAWLVRASRA